MGNQDTNNEMFDNALFWNHRYERDPALGSGIGSRGQNLLHKRATVSAFLNQVKPKEVLDVGCGDCEVLSGMELAASYLGVDISSSIIARNERRFADKAFACLDFAALVDVHKYRADTVLCFEVLIHQHRWDEYVRLVANLVAATRKRGLISGYVSNPRPAISSEIIAWHEPLVNSLHRAGAVDIQVLALSLENPCLGFLSFGVS
jgi:SAM-dependent methyltransferase